MVSLKYQRRCLATGDRRYRLLPAPDLSTTSVVWSSSERAKRQMEPVVYRQVRAHTLSRRVRKQSANDRQSSRVFRQPTSNPTRQERDGNDHDHVTEPVLRRMERMRARNVLGSIRPTMGGQRELRRHVVATVWRESKR